MRKLSTSLALAWLSSFALPGQTAITDSAAPAKRIWSASMQEQQEVWFRRTVDLAKPGTKVRVWFSCDNECEVFVDGRQVGTGNDHQQLTLARLAQPLTGKVTIAVH